MNKLYLFFISTMLVLFTACKDENKPPKSPKEKIEKSPLELINVTISANGVTKSAGNQHDPIKVKQGDVVTIKADAKSNYHAELSYIRWNGHGHFHDFKEDEIDIDVGGIVRMSDENTKSYNFQEAFKIEPSEQDKNRGKTNIKKGDYHVHVNLYAKDKLSISSKLLYFTVE